MQRRKTNEVLHRRTSRIRLDILEYHWLFSAGEGYHIDYAWIYYLDRRHWYMSEIVGMAGLCVAAVLFALSGLLE